MKRIIKISPLAGYRLAVEFEDGVAGIIELESELFGPVFEPLRDEAFFAQVSLDDFGAPCWPTGADLAPDAIYAQLTGQPISRTSTKANSSEQHKRV
jgi:hypothetical protein